MITPLDEVLALTLPTGRGINRVMARNIRRTLSAAPAGVSGDAVFNRLRRVVAETLPQLSAAMTDAVLASWVSAARNTAPDLPTEPRTIAATETRYPQIETAAAWLQEAAILPPYAIEVVKIEAERDGAKLAADVAQGVENHIRQQIVAALTQGSDVRKFARTNAAATGLADYQLEAIYRTNLGLAYKAGQLETLSRPIVSQTFPYVRYYATHDTRVEPDHLSMEWRGLNGTSVYRADDPVIQKFWPPWRWSCRCHVVAISIEDAAALGVREARAWAKTDRPPREPEYVPHPPFDLPRNWSA